MENYVAYFALVGFLLLLGLLVWMILQHRSVKDLHRSVKDLLEGKKKEAVKGPSSDLKPLLQTLLDEVINILQETRSSNSTPLQTLLDEVKEIRASLNGITDRLQGQELSYPQESEDVPFLHQEGENPLQSFCNHYNASVKNQEKQASFREKYEKKYRIGVANSTERRRNRSILPIFETDTSGDLYAYHIEQEDLYAVVPRLGLTLQAEIHASGAFGEVFECPNFNPQSVYPQIKVIRPAIFEPHSAQKQWTLKEKGELDLGWALENE